MKKILQINGIVEGLAGFLLIFDPQLLLYHPQPELHGVVIAKLYGILALCFGIVSYLVSHIIIDHHPVFKKIILVIISFHLAVGLYMYGLYQQNITPHLGASGFHLILAIAFLGIYLKNIKTKNAE